MKPTGPIPPYFSASDDGQLMIGGYSAEELVAEAGGTPLFVYDNNIVGAQVARFKGAMADGIALHYSVTANPYEPLLEFLGRYVDGFRIVSLGELQRLQQRQARRHSDELRRPRQARHRARGGGQGRRHHQRRKRRRGRRAIRAGETVGIQPKISVRVTPPFTIEDGTRHASAAGRARSESMPSASPPSSTA